MADALAKPVSDILNFEGLAAQDQSAATGAGFDAQGAQVTQQGYQTAEDIAGQNEQLAILSGNLENVQTEREVQSTLGSQQAQVAAAGFGNSGSALYLAAASRRQGYLKEQLTGMQSSLEAGGYAAQGAAAKSEADAAGVASSAALQLQSEEASQATLMKSYAAAEAGALTAISSLPGATPEQRAAGSIGSSVAGGGQLSAGALQQAAEGAAGVTQTFGSTGGINYAATLNTPGIVY